MGPEWEHDAGDHFYKICKTYTVATPPKTVREWLGELTDPIRKPKTHGAHG